MFLHLVLVFHLIVIIKGDTCITPESSNGNCVRIHDCPVLLDLIHQVNRSPQEVELLRNSTCGFEGTVPKVCCPYQCITSDGKRGKCVSKESCTSVCKDCEVKRCYGTESICCELPPSSKPLDCSKTINSFPPRPEEFCCGINEETDSILIGNNVVSLAQYPWLVLIEYQGHEALPLCGGVLISGRYVMTAARCVASKSKSVGEPTSVRLGEYDTSTEIDCVLNDDGEKECYENVNETVSILIEEMIIHPLYDPVILKNDIALIRLRKLTPYTDFIRPICLPTVDHTLVPPPVFRLFAAGFGETETTMKLHEQLPFVTDEMCQKIYNNKSHEILLWKGQICAGGKPGRVSCKTNSGGPLMFLKQRTYEVIGVASIGPHLCGLQQVPTVYTKVYEYIDWVYSNIKP